MEASLVLFFGIIIVLLTRAWLAERRTVSAIGDWWGVRAERRWRYREIVLFEATRMDADRHFLLTEQKVVNGHTITIPRMIRCYRCKAHGAVWLCSSCARDPHP